MADELTRMSAAALAAAIAAGDVSAVEVTSATLLGARSALMAARTDYGTGRSTGVYGVPSARRWRRCHSSVSVTTSSRPIVPPTWQARATPQRSAIVPISSAPIGVIPAKTSA